MQAHGVLMLLDPHMRLVFIEAPVPDHENRERCQSKRQGVCEAVIKRAMVDVVYDRSGQVEWQFHRPRHVAYRPAVPRRTNTQHRCTNPHGGGDDDYDATSELGGGVDPRPVSGKNVQIIAGTM